MKSKLGTNACKIKGRIMNYFRASLYAVSLSALIGCTDLELGNQTASDDSTSISQSIIADPQNSLLHYQKGVDLLQFGGETDARLAQVAFKVALRENPNEPRYYKALAAALQKLGDQKESLIALLRSQELMEKSHVDFESIALQAYRAGYFSMSFSALQAVADKSSPAAQALTEAFSGSRIDIANLTGVEPTDLQIYIEKNNDNVEGSNEDQQPQKVKVDVLLLLQEESDFRSTGVDTLGQLNLLLSGDIYNYNSSYDIVSSEKTGSRDRELTVSLGETVNYGLNIFRDSKNKFKLETAPSIILQEGASSEFSAISETFALTYDQDTGELDDADSFLETGLSVELTANEVSENSINLDISVGDGEIISSSSNSTNKLNTSFLETENIKYKANLDIPFGPIVSVAEFRSTLDDQSGYGTRGVRQIPWLGNLFGIEQLDSSLKNGLLLISVTKLDIATEERLLRSAYDSFFRVYKKTLVSPPRGISMLPHEIPSVVYDLGQ